jgi:two-component system response regulator RegX3
VLLDVMLPDGDGRDLAREIRKESKRPDRHANGQERGDRSGARTRARRGRLRRQALLGARAHREDRSHHTALPVRDQKSPIEIGALRLDPTSRTLTRDDASLETAAREFKLLHLLMANAGEVLRRERIMHEVWGPQCFGWTKTLDVHISWLRTNIEDDASHPTRITTVTTDRSDR